MPRHAMEQLTEAMFYVLMSLCETPRCGVRIVEEIERRTEGEVRLGPATLYTVLAKFEKEKYIKEIKVEGRSRTYAITEKGLSAYRTELARLRACLVAAEKGEEKYGEEK